MSILGNYVRRKIDDVVGKRLDQLSQRLLELEDRTGQDRTGQDRTGQDRTGQDRTGQVSYLSSDCYDVCLVNKYNRSFFIVMPRGATDSVSQYVRIGGIPIENIDVFKKPGVFLDLGANIGCCSIMLGTMGWKGFAFEANPINTSVLYKSIRLNDIDIQVIPKIIHERTGKLKFFNNGPYGMVFTDIASNLKYDEVASICLDDWSKEQNIDKLDFIKIDIEGSEVAALKGAKEMLIHYDYPVILCEVNTFTLAVHGETQLSLFNAIKDLKYNAYVLKGNIFEEFHMDEIPTTVINDVWFIKNTDNLRYNIVKKAKKTQEEMVEQIVAQLRNHKQWTQINGLVGLVHDGKSTDYVCLALKDYPEYYTHPLINTLLKDIVMRDDKYPFLDKMIVWFQHMGL